MQRVTVRIFAREPSPARARERPPAGPLVRGLVALGLAAVFLAAFLVPTFLALGRGARMANAVFTKTKVPPAPKLPRTTFLYDRNGHLLMALHGEENRTPIPFRQMPHSLREAVIAAEDADYYTEGGISWRAILRAAMVNLRAHRVVQGGSTITQQYVKDVYTGSRRTVARKVREAIIALKLSRMYTKNQILRKYLNEVYLGHGSYGVQAAAQTYFGKDARDLKLLQSATLAGIIAAPSQFDPISNPGDTRGRRNYVLTRMAHLGYISRERAATLSTRPVQTSTDHGAPIPAQYFLSYVRKALEAQFGTRRTFEGGLRVTTTLDLRLQRAARVAVTSHLRTKGDPSAALIAIDPHTGQALAMVGGRNQRKVKFNLATQAHRQAGSAFKVYTLAAALERGYSLQSLWNGPPSLLISDPRCFTVDPATNVYGPWNVSNYADESAGTMTLLDGIANSVNTIFSQVALSIGPDAVAQMAHRMGVRSPLAPVCSITLGTQPVTPLDMVTGYSTVAARGVRHMPTGILVVKDSSKHVVDRQSDRGKQVLEPHVADLVTYALQGVIQHGTGTAANIGRPAAGKTGTAQNYHDAWFCGYVPQLVTCVWVGYPQGEIGMYNVEGFPEVFGGSIPALIWHDFMSTALAHTPPIGFPSVDPAVGDTHPAGSVGGPPLPGVGGASPSPTTQPTP
jgi:membrane peptidoglycan carboxypeptidase